VVRQKKMVKGVVEQNCSPHEGQESGKDRQERAREDTAFNNKLPLPLIRTHLPQFTNSQYLFKF
jgi:hypothetical protein